MKYNSQRPNVELESMKVCLLGGFKPPATVKFHLGHRPNNRLNY